MSALIKNKLTLFLLIFLTIIDIFNLLSACSADNSLKFNNILPWTLYYNTQLFGTDESTIHLFSFLIIFPILFSWILIYIKNNSLYNIIITRRKISQLIKENLRLIFIFTLSFKLFLTIIELFIISIFFHPMSFSPTLQFNGNVAFVTFYNNVLFQFFIYTLLTTIGWGILGCFFYSVFLFIKKTFLIVPTALLLDLILTILPTIIPNNNLFICQIMYIPMLSMLQSPGNLTFHGNNPPLSLITTCLISSIFYISLIYLLTRIYINKTETGQLI